MENDQTTSYNGNSNAQSYQGNYQPYNLGYNANTGYGYNTSLTDPFPTRMFQPNSTGIYQSIFGQVSPTPYQLKLDNYAHTAPDYAALQKPTGNPGTDINPIQQTDNWWQKTYKNIGGRQGLMDIGNSALSAASAFLPGKSELKGPNAGLTAGLDSAYDAAANAVSTINPLIGGIMKANGFVNKGLNAIGGGTDGMTKADSILGSAFFTPIGAVNGFFGKRAKSFYQNEFLKAQAGDSYNATDYTMDEASKKQNKKYGLISGAARRRANSEIDEAARQQNALSGIIDDSSTRTALQSSMNMVNSNKLALDLQGGVSSNLLQMAKKGAVLRRVQNIIHPSIIEKQEDPDFSKFKATLPEGLVPDGYMLEESWRYNDKPLTFEEALDNTNMFLPGTDGLGLKVNSMAYNPNTEEYQYMYPSDHAKAIKFKDWLETSDSDYFKEIYKKNPNKPFLSFQANEPTVRSAAFVPFPGTSYDQIDEDAVQTNKEKWLEYLEEHPLNVQLSHGQIAKYKGTVLSKIPNAATNLEIASYLSGDPYNVLSQIQIAQIEKQLFNQDKDKSEKKEDKKEEKKEESKSPEKYQKGGSLNIIPDGALHARKHSIDMENITKKGIPVVAEQDGQVVQQAEVEKEEIIFRYSVTQKLENLKQKYDETNDDQYAIAAGKLLTKEIIYNTQDNTQVLL